jgi:RHS repeat-associated protein
MIPGTTGARDAVTASGAAAALNPIRYIGGYELSNGTYHLGYRYYDPSTGRFNQPDPTSQESNAYAYAYANDDQINHSDATGETLASDIFGGVLSGIALAFAVGALFTLGPEITVAYGLSIALGFGVSLSSLTFSLGLIGVDIAYN